MGAFYRGRGSNHHLSRRAGSLGAWIRPEFSGA